MFVSRVCDSHACESRRCMRGCFVWYRVSAVCGLCASCFCVLYMRVVLASCAVCMCVCRAVC